MMSNPRKRAMRESLAFWHGPVTSAARRDERFGAAKEL
jgi:hypothetical protein